MTKIPDTPDLFRRMQGKNVLVIGDVMIDSYLHGTVERISPEAPVPVVSLKSRTLRPGGAANVAVNLSALGAQPWLCSVTGTDKGRDDLTDMLTDYAIRTEALVQDDTRPTTTKFRIIGNNNHILRVDEERTDDISTEIENELLRRIQQLMDNIQPELVILQDYNKGVLTEKIIRTTISQCRERGILSAVDPKKKNFATYSGATLFKPNLKEFLEGTNTSLPVFDLQQLQQAITAFQQEQNIQLLLLTLSEKGIMYSKLLTDYSCRTAHFNAEVRKISDVSGAGDTVISVAALALTAGANVREATFLANLAAGQVCEFPGVVPVNKTKLKEAYARYLTQYPEGNKVE
ncbi:MAG: bifunctional ADP-heptose synthase [Bacteroidales bacterium]|nr:bifunctional ADP-heptose synthase [Bacteroidales bacterium]